jgi:hypothetical protein
MADLDNILEEIDLINEDMNIDPAENRHRYLSPKEKSFGRIFRN